MEQFLYQKLLQSIAMVSSAEEYLSFGSHLRKATHYQLNKNLTKKIQDIIKLNPSTIEKNLDMIKLYNNGIWIEFSDNDRNTDTIEFKEYSKKPNEIGILIVPDPNEQDRIVVMTAWSFDQTLNISHAGAAFSLEDLSHHSYEARKNLYDKNKNATIGRIYKKANPFIQDGFKQEIFIMTAEKRTEDEEEKFELIMKQHIKDIITEFPFMFASLISIGGKNVETKEKEDISILSIKHDKKHFFKKIIEKFKKNTIDRIVKNKEIHIKIY